MFIPWSVAFKHFNPFLFFYEALTILFRNLTEEKMQCYFWPSGYGATPYLATIDCKMSIFGLRMRMTCWIHNVFHFPNFPWARKPSAKLFLHVNCQLDEVVVTDSLQQSRWVEREEEKDPLESCCQFQLSWKLQISWEFPFLDNVSGMALFISICCFRKIASLHFSAYRQW